jgi:hypothetical protein
VRLSPARDLSGFDLEKILEKYILHPPVPIEFEGRPVGGDYHAIIEKPWLEQPISIPFSQEQTALVEKVLGKVPKPLSLMFVPLDLTAHSSTPNLAGQALVAYVDGLPEEWLSGNRVKRSAFVQLEERSEGFNVWLQFRDEEKLELLGARGGIQEREREFSQQIRNVGRRLEHLSRNGPWLRELEYLVRNLGWRTSNTEEDLAVIDRILDPGITSVEETLRRRMFGLPHSEEQGSSGRRILQPSGSSRIQCLSFEVFSRTIGDSGRCLPRPNAKQTSSFRRR